MEDAYSTYIREVVPSSSASNLVDSNGNVVASTAAMSPASPCKEPEFVSKTTETCMWHQFGLHGKLPCINRPNGHFCSKHMAINCLLGKYVKSLPVPMLQLIRAPWVSAVSPTPDEINALEKESVTCWESISKEPLLNNTDTLVSVEDVHCALKVLESCHNKWTNPSCMDEKFGFLKGLKQDGSLVAFLKKGLALLVPTFFLKGIVPRAELEEHSLELLGWDTQYLSFCCQLLYRSHEGDKPWEVVDVQQVLPDLFTKNQIQQYWPCCLAVLHPSTAKKCKCEVGPQQLPLSLPTPAISEPITSGCHDDGGISNSQNLLPLPASFAEDGNPPTSPPQDQSALATSFVGGQSAASPGTSFELDQPVMAARQPITFQETQGLFPTPLLADSRQQPRGPKRPWPPALLPIEFTKTVKVEDATCAMSPSAGDAQLLETEAMVDTTETADPPVHGHPVPQVPNWLHFAPPATAGLHGSMNTFMPPQQFVPVATSNAHYSQLSVTHNAAPWATSSIQGHPKQQHVLPAPSSKQYTVGQIVLGGRQFVSVSYSVKENSSPMVLLPDVREEFFPEFVEHWIEHQLTSLGVKPLIPVNKNRAKSLEAAGIRLRHGQFTKAVSVAPLMSILPSLMSVAEELKQTRHLMPAENLWIFGAS